VWADQDHRRQRIAWSKQLQRTIDRANALLEAELGIWSARSRSPTTEFQRIFGKSLRQ
jgi:hypothetical protein